MVIKNGKLLVRTAKLARGHVHEAIRARNMLKDVTQSCIDHFMPSMTAIPVDAEPEFNGEWGNNQNFPGYIADTWSMYFSQGYPIIGIAYKERSLIAQLEKSIKEWGQIFRSKGLGSTSGDEPEGWQTAEKCIQGFLKEWDVEEAKKEEALMVEANAMRSRLGLDPHKREAKRESDGKAIQRILGEKEEDEEDEEDEEQEFEVEAIVKSRTRATGIQYYVKWIGWPDSDNTWEPEENLESSKETSNLTLTPILTPTLTLTLTLTLTPTLTLNLNPNPNPDPLS